MVGAFCARLSWTDLEALVTKFQQRVFYGVRPEVRSSRPTGAQLTDTARAATAAYNLQAWSASFVRQQHVKL